MTHATGRIDQMNEWHNLSLYGSTDDIHVDYTICCSVPHHSRARQPQEWE